MIKLMFLHKETKSSYNADYYEEKLGVSEELLEWLYDEMIRANDHYDYDFIIPIGRGNPYQSIEWNGLYSEQFISDGGFIQYYIDMGNRGNDVGTGNTTIIKDSTNVIVGDPKGDVNQSSKIKNTNSPDSKPSAMLKQITISVVAGLIVTIVTYLYFS